MGERHGKGEERCPKETMRSFVPFASCFRLLPDPQRIQQQQPWPTIYWSKASLIQLPSKLPSRCLSSGQALRNHRAPNPTLPDALCPSGSSYSANQYSGLELCHYHHQQYHSIAFTFWPTHIDQAPSRTLLDTRHSPLLPFLTHLLVPGALPQFA